MSDGSVIDALCRRPAGGRFDVSERYFEPRVLPLDERVALLERQVAKLAADVAALRAWVWEQEEAA